MAKTRRAVAAVMTRDLPKFFTPEEVHKILSTDLKENRYPRYDSYKSWALCLFLWHTGARITEAVQVRLVTLQGINDKNKVRVVPVPQQFITGIGEWISSNELKREDLLFSFNSKTGHYHVHKACKYAGIDDERCHPQTFRSSYAVNCLLQGTPAIVLQKWLGHSNIMNTMVFTKVLAVDNRNYMDTLKW